MIAVEKKESSSFLVLIWIFKILEFNQLKISRFLFAKKLVKSKICCIFALAITQGLVVQLVRIHACHAWGRGFESRPDRLSCLKAFLNGKAFLFYMTF